MRRSAGAALELSRRAQSEHIEAYKKRESLYISFQVQSMLMSSKVEVEPVFPNEFYYGEKKTKEVTYYICRISMSAHRARLFLIKPFSTDMGLFFVTA